MHQLTYISTARAGLTDLDVEEILIASRRNNRRDQITGVLVHDGKRFLQALEGYGPSIEATFARIKADPRHRATVMLAFRETEQREFGNWDMACHRVGVVPERNSFIETVDSMIAGLTDKNTKALIGGFARIDRRAA